MNDPLNGLPELCDVNEFAAGLDKAQQFEIYGRHWCPNCKRENRFSTSIARATINQKFASGVPRAKAITSTSGYDGSWENIADKIDRFQGSQFSMQCSNCHQSGRILVQKIAGQVSALVFFDQGNSIATANTPDAVKYYLEQAYACYAVKAFSAALAMYRTALDAILFGEGYRDGMVGKKIWTAVALL